MLHCVAALIAARGGNTKYWIFYSKIFFCSFTIGHLFQPIADVQKNCTPPSGFTYSVFALGSFIWLKLYYIRCTICLATVDTSLHIDILFPSYLRCMTSLFAHVVQYFWMPLYVITMGAASAMRRLWNIILCFISSVLCYVMHLSQKTSRSLIISWVDLQAVGI